MSDPFISIIIPVYNEEKRIGPILHHLQKCCTNTNHEIIIADGGSSDRTVSIAEKLNTKVIHCYKKGRAAQMNEGAGHAKGVILYFLHADTVPPPNFTEHIKKSLQKGYSAGCFQLSFDDPHPILKFYGWCTRFRLTLFRFGDQSLFVKKNLFQRINRFDETMLVMEDQKIVRELKKVSNFCVMDASVTTSARRYVINGVIRLQAVFFLILLFYYIGVRQEILVHVYKELTKPVN